MPSYLWTFEKSILQVIIWLRNLDTKSKFGNGELLRDMKNKAARSNRLVRQLLIPNPLILYSNYPPPESSNLPNKVLLTWFQLKRSPATSPSIYGIFPENDLLISLPSSFG